MSFSTVFKYLTGVLSPCLFLLLFGALAFAEDTKDGCNADEIEKLAKIYVTNNAEITPEEAADKAGRYLCRGGAESDPESVCKEAVKDFSKAESDFEASCSAIAVLKANKKEAPSGSISCSDQVRCCTTAGADNSCGKYNSSQLRKESRELDKTIDKISDLIRNGSGDRARHTQAIETQKKFLNLKKKFQQCPMFAAEDLQESYEKAEKARDSMKEKEEEITKKKQELFEAQNKYEEESQELQDEQKELEETHSQKLEDMSNALEDEKQKIFDDIAAKETEVANIDSQIEVKALEAATLQAKLKARISELEMVCYGDADARTQRRRQKELDDLRNNRLSKEGADKLFADAGNSEFKDAQDIHSGHYNNCLNAKPHKDAVKAAYSQFNLELDALRISKRNLESSRQTLLNEIRKLKASEEAKAILDHLKRLTKLVERYETKKTSLAKRAENMERAHLRNVQNLQEEITRAQSHLSRAEDDLAYKEAIHDLKKSYAGDESISEDERKSVMQGFADVKTSATRVYESCDCGSSRQPSIARATCPKVTDYLKVYNPNLVDVDSDDGYDDGSSGQGTRSAD